MECLSIQPSNSIDCFVCITFKRKIIYVCLSEANQNVTLPRVKPAPAVQMVERRPKFDSPRFFFPLISPRTIQLASHHLKSVLYYLKSWNRLSRVSLQKNSLISSHRELSPRHCSVPLQTETIAWSTMIFDFFGFLHFFSSLFWVLI